MTTGGISRLTLKKAIGIGLISGFTATAIMDLSLIAILIAAGIAPLTCFSMVGETFANLFSKQGLPGSVPLGVAAHYVLGPVLGAFFGAGAEVLPALKIYSRKRAILTAILYAEIVSQPLVALTPAALRMTASETLIWFGGAFGMHLIWGGMLGLVWSLGMKQRSSKKNISQVDSPLPPY